jgi:hypothetical protein
VHARTRGVESFGKGEKDVKRGKIKRKVCVIGLEDVIILYWIIYLLSCVECP